MHKKVFKRKILSSCKIWVILRQLFAVKKELLVPKTWSRPNFITLGLCLKMAISSTFRVFAVNFEPFSNRSLQSVPQEPTGLWVQSLMNVCQHSDTKTIQKLQISGMKTWRCWTFSIFRLIGSHSEVFLKQNAATCSSNNVLHSFCSFVSTV